MFMPISLLPLLKIGKRNNETRRDGSWGCRLEIDAKKEHP